MKLFKSLSENLDYSQIIQLDSAFSIAHINYGKTLLFNEMPASDIAKNSRKNSFSSKEHINDVVEKSHEFDGTGKGYKKNDRIELWKSYWLEYINAFDKLNAILPESVVTAYAGRQAIEIGFKYLLLVGGETKFNTHDLGELAQRFIVSLANPPEYMEWVQEFCEKYCGYVEGGNAEYFRYPAYGSEKFFAGNRLDLRWLSCEFALILSKLIHYAGFEGEFD